jgi:hypothetical protein
MQHQLARSTKEKSHLWVCIIVYLLNPSPEYALRSRIFSKSTLKQERHIRWGNPLLSSKFWVAFFICKWRSFLPATLGGDCFARAVQLTETMKKKSLCLFDILFSFWWNKIVHELQISSTETSFYFLPDNALQLFDFSLCRQIGFVQNH